MKFITTLSCCLALVAFASGAQQDQNNNQKKKGKPQTAQTGTQQKGTTNKTQVVHNPQVVHNAQVQTHHTNTVHNQNVTTNKNLHVNKNVTVNKNLTVNKNVNKVHFQNFNNFHAQQKAGIASAKFNANFHIAGASKWQGAKYGAFRNYHPIWNNAGWWHSHYNHIVLIGGGWYYWNGGYWYPCWGYDPGVAYYPYDGPIYAPTADIAPDQVIASVQTTLQDQGYYQGDVDGLLGPLTRAAIASYQQEHGLYVTSAIDEPTLDALGVS